MRFRPDNRPKLAKLPTKVDNLLDAAFKPVAQRDPKRAMLEGAYIAWARRCVTAAYQHVSEGTGKPVAQVVHAFTSDKLQRLCRNPNEHPNQIVERFITGMVHAVDMIPRTEYSPRFSMDNTSKDITREYDWWAKQHPDFRRELAYEIARNFVSKTIMMEVMDPKDANATIQLEVNKINSDPFDAMIIWNELVCGTKVPQDFGFKAEELFRRQKAFLKLRQPITKSPEGEVQS